LDNDHLLDEHGSFPRDAQPTFAWPTTGLDPELHALDLTTAAGQHVNLPGSYQVNIWSPRTYTHILTLYDKAENVLDQAQVQLTVQPAITGELPASSVCLPATVDLAWTVQDAQKYTVHQGTQLVVNVDRSPGVVTELVSRTVNLRSEEHT